jgi:hypothetical protein
MAEFGQRILSAQSQKCWRLSESLSAATEAYDRAGQHRRQSGGVQACGRMEDTQPQMRIGGFGMPATQHAPGGLPHRGTPKGLPWSDYRFTVRAWPGESTLQQP